MLHHASRNVLPEARRYRPKAYCKEGGVAAEAETSDGLLQLPDAIGLVRQQLVAAQLEGRRVVAGKVATFAVGKVTLELTGEVKKTIGGSGEGPWPPPVCCGTTARPTWRSSRSPNPVG